MNLKKIKFGFIGAGNMAGAILFSFRDSEISDKINKNL